MSVSAIFGTRIAVVPTTVGGGVGKTVKLQQGRSGAMIECSSRPQKKATAHHMKSRPKKTQPWDIRRRPTVYEPLPPLPPDWTLISSGGSDEPDVSVEVESSTADAKS